MTTAGNDRDVSAGALVSTDALLSELAAAATMNRPLDTAEAQPPPTTAALDALGAAHANELWDGKHEPNEGPLSSLGLGSDADFKWSADDAGDAGTKADDVLLRRSSNARDRTARTPITTRKAKKRYRHEVLRLRESAAELEQQLAALKSHQDRAERVLSSKDEGSGLLKWQKVAKTEIQTTARARLENAKLKENVNTHRNYSTSLQKMLSRRPLAHDELLGQHLPTRPQHVASSRATAKEIAIYDQLVKSVDARVGDLEVASKVAELADINSARAIEQQATVSDFTIQLNEDQALCIDLVDRYIVPFDFQNVALVLWEYVLSRVLKLTNRLTHTEVIKSTSDLIVTKQSANSNLMIKDHQFTTEYSVTKRILGADRVDFLWESITVSTGSVAQGTPAIQLVQKGWGTIAKLKTLNGSSATSLLTYTCLTPSATVDAAFFPADASLGGKLRNNQLEAHPEFDVRRLATHIVSGYRLHVASVRNYIENTLIDEMLQTAKSTEQSC